MAVTDPTKPRATSASLLGILCLVAGIAVFSVQDMILKGLSGQYPLYQVMVVRAVTAIPFLLLLLRWEGPVAALFSPGWPWMVLRGLVMFVAYLTYYLALASLPLATAVALYFAGPLFITLLSVGVLKERVGALAWAAVMTGFGGVLVMVRPGTDLFDWAALLPVLSGLAYGIAMVAARRMGASQSASALAFWGNAVFLVCAAGLAALFGSGGLALDGHPSLEFLTRGWVSPDASDLGLMMLTGVVAAAGLWLLTQAYRVAQASVVAPFEYTGMIWGVVWGWLVWREWPGAVDWLGIAVILGAGLAVLWAEARRGRG
jgi:drug/metabolite transporter (DMT)-like permease